MRFRLAFYLIALVGAACSGAANTYAGETASGYGRPTDIAFAKQLWAALERDRWVGASRRPVPAQTGEHQHGSMLQVAKGKLGVEARIGRVIVKANHRGVDLTPPRIEQNSNRYLTGYAVMFRREPGYDPDNRDWFWAVFYPGGTVRIRQDKIIAGQIDTGDTNGYMAKSRTGFRIDASQSRTNTPRRTSRTSHSANPLAASDNPT